jgi:hypothetical protein
MKTGSLHRLLAPAIVLPLALTVLSGMAIRVGRSWFGLSGDFGRWMMAVHECRYIGEPLVPLYVLSVGLALLAMIGSGLSLLGRRQLRSWHAWLLQLHQGSYLGKDLRVIYVLLLDLGGLALMGTGLGMTSLWRRHSAGLGR